VIENHWKFKMAEGPLVSVQHRSTAARTLATGVRDSCVAARHLTATLLPERRPRVSVEAGLISVPLELGEVIRHFPTSPDAASLCFIFVERTTPVSSSIRRFLLNSPRLQHPPTTLTFLLAQDHREKLGTATPPLLYLLRRTSPVRVSLPARLSNPHCWWLCHTPLVVSPPYQKQGRHCIP
jgi:hypothetical protein